MHALTHTQTYTHTYRSAHTYIHKTPIITVNQTNLVDYETEMRTINP